MDYVEQSHQELVLTLSECLLDELHVIEEQNFQNDWVKVKLAIIGSSHCLQINDAFFEVFAANSIQKSAIYSENIADLKPLSLKFKGFNYSFSLTQALEYDVDADLVMIHDFPARNNEEKPKTTLTLKAFEDNICISTLHFYPNENKTIFTKTLIYKK